MYIILVFFHAFAKFISASVVKKSVKLHVSR